MSTTTATLIFGAFLIYLMWQGIKNFQLHNMNVALEKKDYSTVVRLSEMPMTRKMLGIYACDLYKLRAYYLEKNVSAFETTLQHMINTTYPNLADKKNFLELYFHTFLLKGNRKYADWLLAAIRQIDDAEFVRYQEQAYAVMLDHRTDLIEEMIAQINTKKYYGFPLGVILFMIAKQYTYLQDDENAIIYYQNAKVCFHPKAVYVPVIVAILNDLGCPLEEQNIKPA